MRLFPIITVLALALSSSGCGPGDAGASASPSPSAPSPSPTRTIGLYSSLPIAWNESEDIRGLLSDNAAPHWALPVLRERGEVAALDSLADGAGRLPLPADGLLVLAQPRPLSPQENVALDAWVLAGGRVLLLADPMLTAHTIFAPGDPRRPQDIAMLSPILGRWGLVLEFDDGQPAGETVARIDGADFPVNLRGALRLSGKSGDGAVGGDASGKSGNASGKAGDAVAACRIGDGGLVAECTAGKGRVVVVADAAVLENSEDSTGIALRKAALARLLDRPALSAGTAP